MVEMDNYKSTKYRHIENLSSFHCFEDYNVFI